MGERKNPIELNSASGTPLTKLRVSRDRQNSPAYCSESDLPIFMRFG